MPRVGIRWRFGGFPGVRCRGDRGIASSRVRDRCGILRRGADEIRIDASNFDASHFDASCIDGRSPDETSMEETRMDETGMQEAPMDRKDKVRQHLERLQVLDGVMPTRVAATREARQAWTAVAGDIATDEVQTADMRSRDLLGASLPADAVQASAIESLADSDDRREQLAAFARAGIGLFHASGRYLAASAEDRRAQGGNDAVTRVLADGPRLLLETPRLIVRFEAGAERDEIAAILRRYGLHRMEAGALPPGLVRAACTAGNATEMAFALMQHAAVVFAEPDFLEHIGQRHVPGDPDYLQQWHHPRMDLDRAWDISTGAGVRVAVIDNGFDATHPDLAFGPQSGWFRATPDLIDADFIPGMAGMPGGWHGTACAGMVAAREGNGIGGCGVAFGSELMAIACGPYHVKTQSSLASALAYAARPDREGVDGRGADVVCCSLGPNGAAWTMQEVLAEAIGFVSAHGRDGRGAPLFWASTNGNHPISADEVCACPQVIAVGRSTRYDFDNGSGFGDELECLAPGVDVWLPTQGGRYATLTGTSFAAPAAAGVAALVLSAMPALTAAELRDRLRSSCDKIGPLPYVQGRNARYGFGRLNALNALQ